MPEPAAWPADRRITITDLQAATDRGERWSMLTSYDTLTAGVFEQAGVRALLVGDTSAEIVLGFQTTVPMTMDQLIPMVQAVVRGTRTALVVADLPFGSYEAGPEVALRNAVRHLKEGGAQAVKLEGGHRVLPQVRAMTAAGVPVMGHLGLTPQSVNTLGGVRRVQGRGTAGDQLLADARALQDAGAFAGHQAIRDFSLDALCSLFGVEPHDRHTAGGDAFITAQILLRLLRLAKRHQRTTLGAICVPYVVERAGS